MFTPITPRFQHLNCPIALYSRPAISISLCSSAHIPFTPIDFDFDDAPGAENEKHTMQSLRNRMGTVLKKASGTLSTESDEERPPSPGGSSIKSTPSKRKRKISIFRPDRKRTQNTSDSPSGIVDSSSHAGSLPVGDDSTTLPKPLGVSFTEFGAKEAHVDPIDPQPHQALVQEASPALTNEQEDAMQFSVPQGEGQTEGVVTQIGSETTKPQNQTSTELKTAYTALSSSVDMNASAFEIIPSIPEPQPAQGENGGVQGSVERCESPERLIAVVQPAAAQGTSVVAVPAPELAKDDTPVVQITPASPTVAEADSEAVFNAAGRPPVILQPVPVQLEDHHGDTFRRMDQGDHHDADDETLQSSSLDQSAILNNLDSIVYTGGARRYSQDTTPPTTAEGEVFGIKSEAPVEDYRTVGWVRHQLLDNTYYYTRTMTPSFPMSSDIFTLVTDLDLRKEGVLKFVKAEIATALPQLRSFTNQGASDLWICADSDPASVTSEPSGPNTPPTTSHTNLRWISHGSRSVTVYPKGTANGVIPTSPEETPEETERKQASAELEYWQYIEKHPAHTSLTQGAKEEAVQGLTWSHADWLLHQDHPIPNEFTQEECKNLLKTIEDMDSQEAGPRRTISTRIIASVLSRISKYRLGCLRKKMQGEVLAPRAKVRPNLFFRRLVGIIVLLICCVVLHLCLDPANTDPFAQYRQINAFGGPNHARDGHRYSIFEDASLVAERRANAMLYGAGISVTVCLAALFVLLQSQLIPSSPSSPSQPPNRQRLGKHRQAAVVITTATALLTMRPPTDSPSRAAGVAALVLAGASFVAGGTAVFRLWRLSSSAHYFGTAGSFFGDLLPAATRDGEPLVLNLRSVFSPTPSRPSSIAPSSTAVPPVPPSSRWIF